MRNLTRYGRRTALRLPVTVDGFSSAWLGTRREGSVDCIALLPHAALRFDLDQDSLSSMSAPRGSRIVVWAGAPSDTAPGRANSRRHARHLSPATASADTKRNSSCSCSIQTDLLDERVRVCPAGDSAADFQRENTADPAATTPPDGMVDNSRPDHSPTLRRGVS